MLRPAVVLLSLTTLLAACGGSTPDTAPPAGGELTPFQLENGIGPVTAPVELGAIDPARAAAGKVTFEGKCMACHKMTERYVGPALGGVVGKRTAAYVMNMILNPEEMYTKHPVARQLLAEHMTQMPNLQVTLEQAREVVEYLRTQTSETAGN